MCVIEIILGIFQIYWVLLEWGGIIGILLGEMSVGLPAGLYDPFPGVLSILPSKCYKLKILFNIKSLIPGQNGTKVWNFPTTIHKILISKRKVLKICFPLIIVFLGVDEVFEVNWSPQINLLRLIG